MTELQAGSTVVVDSDFTCLAPWSVHIVREDKDGLWIGCGEGAHYLDGQLNTADEDDSLVGIYHATDFVAHPSDSQRRPTTTTRGKEPTP